MERMGVRCRWLHDAVLNLILRLLQKLLRFVIAFAKERERIFLVTALILKKSEVDALRLDVDGLFKDVIGNCANVLTVAAHLVA